MLQDAALATCSIEEAEGVLGGPGCTDQDRFEDYVRRMFGYASVKNFVGTLGTLANIQKRGAGGESSPPAHQEKAPILRSI